MSPSKRQKINAKRFPLHIFLDLDETLVNTQFYTTSNSDRIKIVLGVDKRGREESYFVMPRPNVLQMLEECRAVGPTFIMTAATKDYALAINKVCGLGFSPEQIIAREDYESKDEAGLATIRPCDAGQSVLVDNMLHHEDYAVLKRKVLGISRYRYLQIREYAGGKDPDVFDEEWLEIIQTIKYIKRNNDNFGT